MSLAAVPERLGSGSRAATSLPLTVPTVRREWSRPGTGNGAEGSSSSQVYPGINPSQSLALLRQHGHSPRQGPAVTRGRDTIP